MKLITCLLILIPLVSLSQMKMSIDPKTSKIKYDVLGSVIALSGDVFRSDDDGLDSRRVGFKFGIKKGDIITTGKNSFVKIQLIDETVISLGPDTHFSFKDYNFESITDRNANFDLLKGKMRIKVNNKIERGKLKFNTMSISLGVRGTEFLANQSILKTGQAIEQVALLSGKLEINGKDANIKKTLSPNMYVRTKRVEGKEIRVKYGKLSKKTVSKLSSNIKGNKDFLRFLDDKDQDFNFSKSERLELNSIDSSKKKDWKNWKDSLKKLNQKYHD